MVLPRRMDMGGGRGVGMKEETQCNSSMPGVGGDPLFTTAGLAQPRGWWAAPPTGGGASVSPAASQALQGRQAPSLSPSAHP